LLRFALTLASPGVLDPLSFSPLHFLFILQRACFFLSFLSYFFRIPSKVILLASRRLRYSFETRKKSKVEKFMYISRRNILFLWNHFITRPFSLLAIKKNFYINRGLYLFKEKRKRNTRIAPKEKK